MLLKKLQNKKTTKKILIILAILIVPPFIFWGSGNLIHSKQEPSYAGRISGKKISFLQYKDSLDAVKNQAIIQFQDNLPQIEKYLNLEYQAWIRLILLVEAGKRKINVSDREVIELIQSYPFFQRNNQFDSKIYSHNLRYELRTQARIFEEQIRQSLMLIKLYNEVTDNVKISEEEIKELYQKENEEISLYYIGSFPPDFVKDITPIEHDIKDYFTNNPLQFKLPLSFNIEYISFPLADNLNENSIKDKTKNLSMRLESSEEFAQLAKDYNLAVKETGLFRQTEAIPGIGWSPEISNLISKLKTGQISGPIQTDNYYYLLRLKEKQEPHIPNFETIKDKVKEMFIKDKSRERALSRINECLNKLKEAHQTNPNLIDFNKTAQDCSLKSDFTAPFKYGSYIENIGASDNLWMVAQGLKDDDFSEIIDMPSGFYIIKLKSRTPIDEKKFEAEKTEFTKKFLAQKKQRYFNKFLDELKKTAEASLDFNLP